MTDITQAAHLRPVHDAATDARIAAFVEEQTAIISRANARIVRRLSAEGYTLDSARATLSPRHRLSRLVDRHIADPRAVAEGLARSYGHHFRTLVPVEGTVEGAKAE